MGERKEAPETTIKALLLVSLSPRRRETSIKSMCCPLGLKTHRRSRRGQTRRRHTVQRENQITIFRTPQMLIYPPMCLSLAASVLLHNQHAISSSMCVRAQGRDGQMRGRAVNSTRKAASSHVAGFVGRGPEIEGLVSKDKKKKAKTADW